MAEYIEREAISEGIRKYYYKNPPNSSYEEGFDRGLDRAQRAILDAPAADVAMVRHGRWIKHDDGVFTCGECENAESNESYFCRYCGAKMDGCDDNSDMV